MVAQERESAIDNSFYVHSEDTKDKGHKRQRIHKTEAQKRGPVGQKDTKDKGHTRQKHRSGGPGCKRTKRTHRTQMTKDIQDRSTEEGGQEAKGHKGQRTHK